MKGAIKIILQIKTSTDYVFTFSGHSSVNNFCKLRFSFATLFEKHYVLMSDNFLQHDQVFLSSSKMSIKMYKYIFVNESA